LKSTVLGENAPAMSSGRNSVWNHPNIMEVFWVFKNESILPIQIPEKNETMLLFDLQTVSFSVLKNATKIAVLTPPNRSFF